mgnify:CR=1 FL=1
MSSDFKPGQGYTREDWDAVDSPELTAEELATARPFAEVYPDLADAIRRSRGRPKIEAPKQQISLRLDSEVIEKFKATGKGWQSRINDVLKAAKL